MMLIITDVEKDEVFLKVVRMCVEGQLRACVAGGSVYVTGLISNTNHHGVGSHDELHEAGVEDSTLLVGDREVDVVLPTIRGEPMRWLRRASSAM